LNAVPLLAAETLRGRVHPYLTSKSEEEEMERQKNAGGAEERQESKRCSADSRRGFARAAEPSELCGVLRRSALASLAVSLLTVATTRAKSEEEMERHKNAGGAEERQESKRCSAGSR
jgi:hypothetical protein